MAKKTLKNEKNTGKNTKSKAAKAAGVDKDQFFSCIDKMAHDAMVSGSPQNTMRDMTEEDVKELYKQLW